MSDAAIKQLTARVTALERRLKRLEVQRPSWQNWTPTVIQSTSVSVTVTSARYMTIGKTVIAKATLAITGSGVAGNAIRVSNLPFPISGNCSGSGRVLDAGTAHYGVEAENSGATLIQFYGYNVGNAMGIAPSFALASGDTINFSIVYERT